MGSRRVSAAAVIAAALAVCSVALGQRREGNAATAVLKVQLAESVRFGSVTVPAHTYRLTLGPEGFAFADVDTMVLVATVTAQVSEATEPVAEPSAVVKKTGAKVELLVKIGNQVARAEGVVVVRAAGGRDVTLAGPTEATVDDGKPEAQSERALIEQAVGLYVSGIKHCADQAHKSRWTSDDPRFVKCVCPVLVKWRLPKVQAPLKIDLPLAKGRSGFSFTAMPDGKPVDCRVWVGATAPAALPPASPNDIVIPPPEPAAAPPPGNSP